MSLSLKKRNFKSQLAVRNISKKEIILERMVVDIEECLDYSGSEAQVSEFCPSKLHSDKRLLLPAAGFEFYRILLLGSFITTVLVGSLISELFLDQLPSLYLAKKTNFVNVFFVKRGWFWTTLAFFLLFVMVETWHFASAKFIVARRSALLGLLRYAMATAYWYIMTQSLLGTGKSSIFTLLHQSTGQCTFVDPTDIDFSKIEYHDCFAYGGKWIGFDISGHCFILIHSSLFLIEEYVFYSKMWIETRSYSLNAMSKTCYSNRAWSYVYWTIKWFLFIICFLWFQNLTITALYHHHWLEKIAGTFFGFLLWLIFYVFGVYRIFV